MSPLTEARALFALRGIANRKTRTFRPLLEPGDVPFRLKISGTIGRSKVLGEHRGTLTVEADGTSQRARSAAELLAAVEAIVPAQAWAAVAAKLPGFRFDVLDKQSIKAANELIVRTRRTEPKRGEVKVELR